MSEKEEIVPEAGEESSNWLLPYNIGIDKLELIVKAFFQAKADTQKVSPTELLGRTGLNINTIKGNMKFLVAVGILKPSDEKDSYTLEPKGTTYSKAIATNDEATTSTTLKELLINSYLKELIDYAQNVQALTFEQLFQHIKGMARLKEDPKYKPWGIAGPYVAGIICIINLLVKAGIVSQDLIAKEEMVRPPTLARKTSASLRKSTQKAEQQSTEVHEKVTNTIGSIEKIGPNIPLTINIVIEAKDPESIKQLIAIIKELKGQTEQSNP